MSQPWQDPQQPDQRFGQSAAPGSQGYPPPAPTPYGQQPYGQPYPPQGYGQPYPAAYPSPGQTPLGQQPLPSNDIGRYAPPKPRGPVVAAVVGAVVLVAVLVAGFFLQGQSVAPAPTPNATAQGTSGLPGQPFIMPNNSAATGRWQVLSREWTDTGVLVQVRVSCDSETCSYGFTSFSNTGSTSVDPITSPRQPQLTRGTLQAGQSTTGWVFLPLPRGAATLILLTSAGRQISALPIAA